MHEDEVDNYINCSTLRLMNELARKMLFRRGPKQPNSCYQFSIIPQRSASLHHSGLLPVKIRTWAAVLAAATAIFLSDSGRCNPVYTKVYTFSGIYPAVTNGSTPNSIAVDAAGNIYGTAGTGGPIGISSGTVFRISPAGKLTVLHAFAGAYDGAVPRDLIFGDDGVLYGATASGGTNNAGTIFKITTNGVFTSLYSFTAGTDGDGAYLSLSCVLDGSIYGATELGGTTYAGNVFRLSPSGIYTILYSFTNGYTGTLNLHAAAASGPTVYAIAPLVPGPDNALYGYSSQAGSYPNLHNIFYRITTNGSVSIVCAFPGGPAGSPTLYYAPIYAGDGNWYAPGEPGAFGYGMICRFTPAGGLTSLYDFTDGTDGSGPSGLCPASDGSFFGCTGFGSDHVSFYDFKTNGLLTVLAPASSGAPSPGLNMQGPIRGRDGYLYFISGVTIYKLMPVPPVPPVLPLLAISIQTTNGTMPKVNLSWSNYGNTYQLQCSTNPNSTNWALLGNPVAGGFTSFQTSYDWGWISPVPQRYYRLLVTP